MELSRNQSIVSWVLQIVVAVILFQTLFFKFTAAEESVYIFRTLGMEPWGRIGSGVVELIAAILLLYRKTTTLGAILSVVLVIGIFWLLRGTLKPLGNLNLIIFFVGVAGFCVFAGVPIAFG